VKIPEQGQMICVRNRYFIVTDVEPYDSVDQSVILHKVSLECLDDDLMGEEMELIWELELENSKKVIDATELPRPGKIGLTVGEPLERLLMLFNWSKSSLVFSDQFCLLIVLRL